MGICKETLYMELLPEILLAQAGHPSFLDEIRNVAPEASWINSVGSFFGLILNIAVGVGITISVIYIILAGVRYITSQGDPKSAEQAKQALTYSLVALVLSISVFAIKALIFNIIGVGSPDLVGGTPGF